MPVTQTFGPGEPYKWKCVEERDVKRQHSGKGNIFEIGHVLCEIYIEEVKI